MKIIIDFYKSLDMINLIIFWGIIIIITLLLVFSIIISNKNKKLKEIINNNKNISKEDTPIVKNINSEQVNQPEKKLIDINEISKNDNVISEEKNFIAEEHVMEYNSDLFSIPNIKKAVAPDNNEMSLETNKFTNKPYQKNILKEISSCQTSPIGLVTPIKKEEKQAEELTRVLNNYENDVNAKKNYCVNENHNISQISTLDNIPKLEVEKNNTTKENYLEKISKEMGANQSSDMLKRTEYEMQQEEDAIISYEELMKRKDSIKIVDEEDAIISIEELVKRQQKDKIYNLTEEEENEKFINELKDFRNSL